MEVFFKAGRLSKVGNVTFHSQLNTHFYFDGRNASTKHRSLLSMKIPHKRIYERFSAFVRNVSSYPISQKCDSNQILIVTKIESFHHILDTIFSFFAQVRHCAAPPSHSSAVRRTLEYQLHGERLERFATNRYGSEWKVKG